MKHAFLAVVAVAALALPGLAFGATATHGSTTKAKVTKPKPLGIVPGFIRTGGKPGQGVRVVKGVLKAAADGPTSADNLTYNGPDQIPPKSLKTLPRVMEGPVQVYTIFWQPVGYSTASNYQTVVNQFFSDVAGSSNTGNSPYDTDGQYFDDSQGPSDSVHFSGSTQDYTPFPKSGCTTPKNFGPSKFTVIGAQVCLSDAQIQKEVKAVADRMGWPHGPNTEFFMYTPHNVESCSDAADCSYSVYCAYHWYFGTNPSNEYIYANMPWPNQAFSANGQNYGSDCDSGEHPNGGGGQTTGSEPGYPTPNDAADEVINVSSHENNEAITDPTGLGWWNDNAASAYAGQEDGDQCAWWWPSDTGTGGLGGQSANGALYTNHLSGHNYFIQGEWSNVDATDEGNSGCQWGHEGSDFTEDSEPSISGTAAVGSTLTGHAGDFNVGNGAVYWYQWERCNGDELSGTLRNAARAHNFAGAPGCTDVRDATTGTANGAGDGVLQDTYKPTAADVGDWIYLCSGVYWGNGELGNNSDCSDAVKVNGEPELSGTTAPPYSWLSAPDSLVPGNQVTLTITPAYFSATPTSYTVQWQDCFFIFCVNTGKPVNVNAAKTGNTVAKYTVLPSDVGQSLRAEIVAKNKAGSSDPVDTTFTDEVGGAPTNTVSPSFTGSSFAVGTAATLNIGTWTAPTAAPITGFTVGLYRCTSGEFSPSTCESISNQTLKATSNGKTVSYTPVAADAGEYLIALVNANSKWSVSAYADDEEVASTTNPVGGISSGADAAPSVSAYGALDQGYAIYLLDMDASNWTNSPTQFRYTVYHCTSPSDTSTCTSETGPGGGASGRVAPDPTNDGAALAGYVPSSSDAGTYIRFAVQADNANGFSAPVWSQAGEESIPVNMLGPTIAQDGDGKGYDITPGTWNNSASQYENVILDCTDDTSTDSCTPVDEIDSIGTDSVEYTPTDAFNTDDFIRVETFAMNDDSLSEGAISDAVAAQPAPPS